MYSFQVSELVIVRVHADAKEQSSITSIDNLVIPELDPDSAHCREEGKGRTDFNKVALVLLIPRSDQTVHFTSNANLLLIVVRYICYTVTTDLNLLKVGHTPFGEPRFALTVLCFRISCERCIDASINRPERGRSAIRMVA